MGIREAFLRFFVSIMRRYEKFIDFDNMVFLNKNFVNDFDDDKEREFVQIVCSTQMFERFIDERIANPSQSEVRFFDESIVVKNSRSKKRTLKQTLVAKGGKKGTPFLSDEAGMVSTPIFFSFMDGQFVTNIA